MTKKYSMTELLQETEDKYGDFEFDIPVRDEDGNDKLDESGQVVVKTATLRYYLRVPRENRKQLAKAYAYINGEADIEEEQGLEDGDGISALIEFLAQTTRGLCATENDYKLIEDRFGKEDLLLWNFLLEKYEEVYDMKDESGE